jgi:type IV secretory pathway VirB2 component (pilin)
MVIDDIRGARLRTALIRVAACILLVSLSSAIWAQSSPFETGANSLVTEFIAIATPIAILLVMGLGIAAATGRISWGWRCWCCSESGSSSVPHKLWPGDAPFSACERVT